MSNSFDSKSLQYTKPGSDSHLFPEKDRLMFQSPEIYSTTVVFDRPIPKLGININDKEDEGRGLSY